MPKTAGTLALLTLLVGAAAGLAGGFVLGSSAETAAPARSAPRAESSAAPAVPAAPADAPAQPSARSRAPTASGSTAAVSVKTGDGKITGTVTLDGAPLAGVLVRGTPSGDDEDDEEEPEPKRPTGAPPRDEDIDLVARKYADRLRRERGGRREATTDAGGAYALTGLGEKAYQVAAWLEGYSVQRVAEHGWLPVETGKTCDFTAAPIHFVRVSALLPDGSVPAAARVLWTGADDDETDTAWTPKDPDLQLEPGTYTIRVEADGPGEDGTTESRAFHRITRRYGARDASSDAAFTSEPQTVTVEGGATKELTFRLTGQPGVRVRVVYPPGEHPRSVRIAAMKLDTTTPADPSRLLGDAKVRARWLDGTTEGLIGGLDAGSYLVGATARGGRLLASATVTVGSGQVTQDLAVPAGDLRDWVKVWVRAPGGALVRDAKIECGCRGTEGNGDCDVNGSAQADGSYKVEHYERDAPSLGGGSSFGGESLGDGERTYFIRATSARYGTAEATYVPATDPEVTVQLFDPAIVRVTVAGLAQSGERDRAVLSIESRDPKIELAWGDREAELDAAGTGKFKPLRPGPYDVILRYAASGSAMDRMNARWRGAEVARASLTAVAGEQTVTLQLTPLSDLVVAVEGDSVEIERVGADGSMKRLQARNAAKDGRVTLKDLAAGRYRLSDDTGEMFVDVPASGVVPFRPRPFDCFHLQMREKGYLVDLGLKTGDLVVAIDGVESKGALALRAAMATAKTRESVKFTIQRGGTRFDVVADGKRFEEDEGSYYRPAVR